MSMNPIPNDPTSIVPPAKVTVETKSAWVSKINWLQILGAIVSLATTNVLGLDDATQAKVLAATTLAQSLGTVVLKTWFTNTITPQSMPPAPPSVG